MTRILVQRGSAGSSSSSNQNRPSASVSVPGPSSSSASSQQQVTGVPQVAPTVKDENLVEEGQEQIVVDVLPESCGLSDSKSEDIPSGSLNSDVHGDEKVVEDEKVGSDDVMASGNLVKEFGGLLVVDEESDTMIGSSFQMVTGSSHPPPPPPVPPPKPSTGNSNSRRFASSGSNPARVGSSRRAAGWPGVSSRSSPTGSRPSSPRSHCEGEGYNSADE